MRVAAAYIESAAPHAPTPNDFPQAQAIGPNPLRIVLIGSGPAVGRGVSSQSLALPGALARALVAGTGRGATVDVVSHTAMTARSARAALGRLLLPSYDAVLLTLGTNESLHLTPVNRWALHLADLLTALTDGIGNDGTIFLTGLRPMRSVAEFDSIVGGVADRHARHLDHIAHVLCSTTPQCVYLPPLSAPSSPRHETDRYRTADQYLTWAKELVSQMAPILPALSTDLSTQDGTAFARLSNPKETF